MFLLLLPVWGSGEYVYARRRHWVLNFLTLCLISLSRVWTWSLRFSARLLGGKSHWSSCLCPQCYETVLITLGGWDCLRIAQEAITPLQCIIFDTFRYCSNPPCLFIQHLDPRTLISFYYMFIFCMLHFRYISETKWELNMVAVSVRLVQNLDHTF